MRSKKGLALAMAVVLGVGAFGMTSTPEVDASSGSMKKVVKYYKQGKMKKARKEAKKLPKTISHIIPLNDENCEIYLEAIESVSDVQEMYLCDYDEDTTAELFIKHGDCEADMVLDCYDVDCDDEDKLIWSVNASHCTVHDYYGTPGMILMSGIQGYEEMRVINVKGKEKKYTRDVGSGSYFNPRCKMKKVKKSYFK